MSILEEAERITTLLVKISDLRQKITWHQWHLIKTKPL